MVHPGIDTSPQRTRLLIGTWGWRRRLVTVSNHIIGVRSTASVFFVKLSLSLKDVDAPREKLQSL